jgi:putative effector of murein hydrolase
LRLRPALAQSFACFLIASLYVFYALKKLYKRTQKTENRPFFVTVLPAAASVTAANPQLPS